MKNYWDVIWIFGNLETNKKIMSFKEKNHQLESESNRAKAFKVNHHPRVVQILAREGSTRIKDKNIREVCGIPLMAYSILVAKAAKNVDRVIMNTDSERYAEIARHYGAEVPFIRPRQLAGTTTPYPAVNCYTISYFSLEEGYLPDCLINFVPTSPFRNIIKIEKMVTFLDKNRFVSTVVPVQDNFNRIAANKGSRLTFLNPGLSENERSSFLCKGAGLFWGMRIATYFDGLRMKLHPEESYAIPPNNKNLRQMPYLKTILVKNPIELIDIDTEADFEIMQDVVKNDLYNFGITLP